MQRKMENKIVDKVIEFWFADASNSPENAFSRKPFWYDGGKIIDQKIFDLEKNNKNLKAKNDAIISQNQKLLARLEKLENIALKIKTSSDIISVATKD